MTTRVIPLEGWLGCFGSGWMSFGRTYESDFALLALLLQSPVLAVKEVGGDGAEADAD